MAPRKKPAPEPTVVAEAITVRPAIQYLADPIAVAHATPKTREDIALRDAVRKALADTEAMVGEFVAGQASEGFSLAEIDQLYALEMPLLFGYRVEGGRIRVSFDSRIVERLA